MPDRETIAESEAITGWMFCATNRDRHDRDVHMWHEPHDLIVAGGTYAMDPVGFHWWGLEPSESACDAVLNARGPICCRVRAWGEVVRGDGRFVAGLVRVEWIEDARAVLREFAIETAGPGIVAMAMPEHMAARAIRSAMPDREHGKGEKARRERAERAMRDRLDERLAGMLEGLRPGRRGDGRVGDLAVAHGAKVT